MNEFTGLHAAVSSGSFEAALFPLDYGFDMEGRIVRTDGLR